MRARGCSLWLLVLAMVLAGALLVERHRLHQAQAARDRAELTLGLDATRVLSATFARTTSLRVAALSGRVLAQGACTSGYLFADQQRTVAPYRVAYAVALAGLTRASYRWDARDRTMFVAAPDVAPEPPAIDLAAAHSVQTGLFVSRGCGMAMQRQVAGRLATAAAARAGRADAMLAAREAARAAIAALVRAPLAAAGLGDVAVRVRFPADPQPNDRVWDRSRSIDDVLADPRFAP